MVVVLQNKQPLMADIIQIEISQMFSVMIIEINQPISPDEVNFLLLLFIFSHFYYSKNYKQDSIQLLAKRMKRKKKIVKNRLKFMYNNKKMISLLKNKNINSKLISNNLVHQLTIIIRPLRFINHQVVNQQDYGRDYRASHE